MTLVSISPILEVGGCFEMELPVAKPEDPHAMGRNVLAICPSLVFGNFDERRQHRTEM